MWLCFNEGFLSVVVSREDKSKVLVRARKREHLEKYFPNFTILSTSNTDYPFRVVCNKADVLDVIYDYVEELSYTNFKSSVKDNKLHNTYNRVWGVMHDVQTTRSLFSHPATGVRQRDLELGTYVQRHGGLHSLTDREMQELEDDWRGVESKKKKKKDK